MQRLDKNELDSLNDAEDNLDYNTADSVELVNLSSTRYHTRSRERSTGRDVGNIRLTDTDTEAEEEDLLLSPGKRQR